MDAVVCVLGAPRSGTSVTARALNRLGVYVGPPDGMVSPGVHNTKGDWEHAQIHGINREILRRLGGTIWQPPAFPDGWALRPEVEGLRQTARKLVEREFGAVRLWGWKDPATCLTLAFWQTLLPHMRYVICIRNPLDVAMSMARQEWCSREHALYIWALYLKSAFENTAGSPRMFTSFERLMCDSATEIQRMAAFIGKSTLQASYIEKVSRECIDRKQWHHRTSHTGLLVAQEAYQVLATPDFSVDDPLHALERALDVLEPAAEADEARRLQQERDRWFHEQRIAKAELKQLVSGGESALLIDSNSLSDDALPAGQLVRFLERDGFSAGPPEDDVAAIEEVERLRRRGVCLVVIAWPAFWWLDWFRELHRYLRSSFPCVMQNERLVVFDMRFSVVPSSEFASEQAPISLSII